MLAIAFVVVIVTVYIFGINENSHHVAWLITSLRETYFRLASEPLHFLIFLFHCSFPVSFTDFFIFCSVSNITVSRASKFGVCLRDPSLDLFSICIYSLGDRLMALNSLYLLTIPRNISPDCIYFLNYRQLFISTSLL